MLAAVLMGLTPAAGQVAKVVAMPPARDFGYLLGDVFVIDFVIETPPGTQLDLHSIPVAGPVSPQMEIRTVSLDGKPTSSHLRVEYQTFWTPEEAMRATVPPIHLAYLSHGNKYSVGTPGWAFLTSPFRHERSPLIDPSALRADHPMQRPQTRMLANGLLASLAVLAAAALWLLLAWRGFFLRPGATAPFGKAARDLRRRSVTPEHALLTLHGAFNTIARRTLRKSDLDRFLAENPRFQALRTEIEKFFDASNAHFFATGARAADVTSLVTLAHRLAGAERR